MHPFLELPSETNKWMEYNALKFVITIHTACTHGVKLVFSLVSIEFTILTDEHDFYRQIVWIIVTYL